MSEFKFVPGEYKTRDGRRALVRFVSSKPCDTNFVLSGEVLMSNGVWTRASWTEDGKFSNIESCGSDLVPIVRYLYKNCFEHDTGGVFNDATQDVPRTIKRYGVLRFEATRQGTPNWRTVEFIPVEKLEHA